MIKVTVELYPFGITEEKYTIGEIFIVNDKTGTVETGNYSYQINDYKETGETQSNIGVVKKHKRSEGIFELIRKILNKKRGCSSSSG